VTEVMSHYSVVKETDWLLTCTGDRVLEISKRSWKFQCSPPLPTQDFCRIELWMGWTVEMSRLGEK